MREERSYLKGDLTKILCCAFAIIILSFLSGSIVHAKTNIKGNTYIDLEPDETCEVPFQTNQKLIFMMPVTATTATNDDCEYGGVRVKLISSEGKVISNDYMDLEGYYKDSTWLYSDGFKQNLGSYKYQITNTSDQSIELKYSILGYKGLATSVKLYKNKKIKPGKWKLVGKVNNADSKMPLIKKIKCKTKVVSGVDVHADGKIYAYGERYGTTTLSVTTYNKKKFKAKVKVLAADPNFGAYLDDYNTRNHYFSVVIKNKGNSNLKIIRRGKVEDVDYKSYDRTLRNQSSVIIKPGKTKTVRFYHNGSTTWYDESGYTLFAKFKYQGKTYEWHVWDEDSVYKKGKKWYSTYWDDDWYEGWY